MPGYVKNAIAEFEKYLEVEKNFSPHTLKNYLVDLRQFQAYLEENRIDAGGGRRYQNRARRDQGFSRVHLPEGDPEGEHFAQGSHAPDVFPFSSEGGSLNSIPRKWSRRPGRKSTCRGSFPSTRYSRCWTGVSRRGFRAQGQGHPGAALLDGHPGERTDRP